MSNGCEGCHLSQRGQNEALINILKQAKDYAIQNEISVAVYKEGYEYFYMEAGAAIAAGYPIVNVVSKHS